MTENIDLSIKEMEVDSILILNPIVPYENNIQDVNLQSLDNICWKSDHEEINWWFCKKCHKKIIEGYWHKKYCNSKKDKHKHKLLKDYTKQFVKDRCCFRCGRKDHYILNCTYTKSR